MFKKANNYEQGRINRKTDFGRDNTGGLDPLAFRRYDPCTYDPKNLMEERARLSEIENELSAIKSQLTIKQPYDVFQQLVARRGKLLDDLRDVRHELRENKRTENDRAGFHKASHLENRMRFEREFLRMAELLLAKDVYDRIFVATQHRMGDDYDNHPRRTQKLIERAKDR
jgi:hypothetical protein